MVFAAEGTANEINEEVLAHPVKVAMDGYSLLREYVMEVDEREDASQPSGVTLHAQCRETPVPVAGMMA